MPEPSLLDKILEMASPMPKQAEAAPWNRVSQLLERWNPAVQKALTKTDLAALERFTEGYPAVRRVAVNPVRPGAIGGGSAWGYPIGDPSIKDWVEGRVKNPYGVREYGSIVIDPKAPNPAIDYAHEAGHTFSGPLDNWVRREATIEPARASKYWTPATAGAEGFAEGLSNVLLDKWNKSADVYYWPHQYRHAPTWLQEPYLKSGYLGRDVGSDIRKGKSVDQNSVIEQLIDFINNYNR